MSYISAQTSGVAEAQSNLKISQNFPLVINKSKVSKLIRLKIKLMFVYLNLNYENIKFNILQFT